MIDIPAFEPGHVGLSVSDLDASLDFYLEVLRLDLVHRSDEPDRRYGFLGHDGSVTVTLWEQAGERFDRRRAGLHHLALRAGSIAEVEAVGRRLRERGIAIRHDGIVAHREGAASGGIFFEDPDGIRLEVFAPDGAAAYAAPAEGPACGFF